jgi:hypothetical protein
MASGAENGKGSSQCPSKFILSFPRDNLGQNGPFGRFLEMRDAQTHLE